MNGTLLAARSLTALGSPRLHRILGQHPIGERTLAQWQQALHQTVRPIRRIGLVGGFVAAQRTCQTAHALVGNRRVLPAHPSP